MMDSTTESRGYTNSLVAPPERNGQPAPALVTLQPVSMPPQDDQQQATLRLRAIMAAFRRRWVVAICLGLLASGMAATAVWYSIPDTYTAFAELLVEPSKRFLYSNRETRQESIPLATYKQTGIRLAKFPFVLTAALRDEEIAQLPTIKQQADPIHWLEENVMVSSPAEQFIRISLTGPHQNDVAPIVNALVEAFDREVVDTDRNQRQEDTDDLKEHLSKKKLELKSLRTTLSHIDKDIKAASKEQADFKMQAQYQVQLELRKNLGQIEWEILQTRVELERLKAERNRTAEEADEQENSEEPSQDIAGTLPEIELPEDVDEFIEAQLQADPVFAEYVQKLDFEKVQLRLYEKRYHPTSSRLVDSRERVDQLEKDIEEYRETQTPVIKEQLITALEEEREAQLAEAGQALASNGEVAVDPLVTAEKQLALLTDRRDLLAAELDSSMIATNDFSSSWVDRQLKQEEFLKVKQEVDELDTIVRRRNVEEEHSKSPIEVKRPAVKPNQPDRGKRMKLAGAAGLGLFGLVVAGVVLLEYSAHRLNSVNEVQTDLNLQVMSTIPLMPRWVNSESGNTRNRRSEYWHSVLTESVDATRTLLLRHAHVNSTKAVMIASATGGEGKTTLSCHLATSLARAGRDVLLIDGDIRRPSVHKVFDLPSKPGFCEVLTGKVDLPDALHEVTPAGLTVLTAGRVDADALRVLAQDKLGQLMEIARNQFDFIILDTSPILPVTDALLMAQFMDGVLFSLRRDVSRAGKVSAAVQRISMLGVNVLGAVAIGLDEGSSKSRYSYYGNGYGYGYGYGQNPHAPGPAAPDPRA